MEKVLPMKNLLYAGGARGREQWSRRDPRQVSESFIVYLTQQNRAIDCFIDTRELMYTYWIYNQLLS